MPAPFLDTNILLRYLTKDDPSKAEQALALLTRVERGEERVVSSPMVIFETVFTLQTFYKVPRPQIQALVEPIVRMRGLKLPDKRIYPRAFGLYTGTPKLSFADAFNVAYMERHGLRDIYTWDAGFDSVPGIRRKEPEREEQRRD